MGDVEAEHAGAQFRQREPERHLAPQHAALAARTALAGDDEHELRPFRLGAAQEVQQRVVRLGLGHAVKIDASADLGAAAGELLALAQRKRVRGRRRLRFGRGGLRRMLHVLGDRLRLGLTFGLALCGFDGAAFASGAADGLAVGFVVNLARNGRTERATAVHRRSSSAVRWRRPRIISRGIASVCRLSLTASNTAARAAVLAPPAPPPSR